MKLFLKRISLILVLSTTLIVIDSCKKTDQPSPTVEQMRKTEMERLSELLKTNPEMSRVIIPYNQKVDGYFSDEDGNRIVNANNYTYQCMDPADMDNPPAVKLLYMIREYDCNQGYRFNVSWEVSIPLPLSSNSPIIPGAVSKGRIRIKNTSSTIIYQDLNLTPVTFTDLGDDPSTGNVNRLWGAEYTTAWIPFTYFSPSTGVIEHSLVSQTDCLDYPAYTTSYSGGSLADATNPCDRIDPVAVNNAQVSGGVYSTNGTLDGFGNVLFTSFCPSPPGSTYPDRQQVQLMCVASGVTDTWRDITPVQGTWPGNVLTDGRLQTFNITTQAGTIGLYDTYYIPNRDITVGGVLQHGAYKVRYRNKMNSGCVGEWSPEISRTF